MKREIKFRVWHQGQNEMFTTLYLTFGGRIGVWNNEETEIDFVSEYPFLELMQYTGLKDKNGIEIYEGDIVEWEDSINEEMYGGEIIYPKETVEFKGGAFYPVCQMTETEFEVIGNIYENPELLK